jgi:DNA polymerase I-like protein with 3'-5' exonuclease and polymerase domains
MAVTMNSLIQAVCPSMPQDRSIKSTKDRMVWYRWYKSTKTLMVPPLNVLRANVIELDRFIEAVKTFSIADLDASTYDWDHLHLYDFEGSKVSEGLDILLETLKSVDRVACDIETKGLEWEDNELLSIGFAVDESTCFAFYHIAPEMYPKLEQVLNLPGVSYIWHNGKFDCGRLKYMCNLNAHVDEDTMLKHYVQINERKGTHGLKDLGQLYLQAPPWDDQLDAIKREYCKKHKVKLGDFTYDLIPTATLIPYMQRDCIATYRLNDLFNQLKRPGSDFIYRKLIEASAAYMQVELNGLRIDMDYLYDLEYQMEQEAKEGQRKLDSVVSQLWDSNQYSKDTGAKVRVGESFNASSPKQLKWMLTQILGYAPPSTDALTLQEISRDIESGKITHPLAKPFIEGVLAARQNKKYMNTYIQGFRNSICRDMRLRGTFNLHGTETGRLSSTNPNMQNIPRDKRIKNLIVSKPGYKLLQLDYSQAELRVLAALSGDPFMQQVYIDGKDLHDAVATDMFGPNFTKEQRVMAKTINFGIAYGRGAASIAEHFNKSMSEATEIIAKWFRPMPQVQEYINNQRRKPRRGEPCVTMFGRERHFCITDDDMYHIQNEYINTPIQSTASDLTMFSLIEITNQLAAHNWDAKIVSTVHDSIILEVLDSPELVDQIAATCIKIMADIPAHYMPGCPVPFKADAEVGYKWGALEEWKPNEV